jgi:hypothetical protein
MHHRTRSSNWYHHGTYLTRRREEGECRRNKRTGPGWNIRDRIVYRNGRPIGFIGLQLTLLDTRLPRGSVAQNVYTSVHVSFKKRCFDRCGRDSTRAEDRRAWLSPKVGGFANSTRRRLQRGIPIVKRAHCPRPAGAGNEAHRKRGGNTSRGQSNTSARCSRTAASGRLYRRHWQQHAHTGDCGTSHKR